MLSQARFLQIISGMTSAAQKVYEVVPKEDAWQPNRIYAELTRKNVSMDLRVMQGCLNTLAKAGLITENKRGEFQAEQVRRPYTRKEVPMQSVKPASVVVPSFSSQTASSVAATPAASLAPVQTPNAAPKAPDAMDILGALAQRAARLSAELKDLSSAISDAAVEVQSQLEAKSEETKKFKLFQELLKEIGEAK